MLKAILTSSAVILSLVMYVPLWRRMLSRRTTGDHSKPYYVMLLALQGMTLVVSVLDNAYWLTGYYVVQICLISITFWMVRRYYNRDPKKPLDSR